MCDLCIWSLPFLHDTIVVLPFKCCASETTHVDDTLSKSIYNTYETESTNTKNEELSLSSSISLSLSLSLSLFLFLFTPMKKLNIW